MNIHKVSAFSHRNQGGNPAGVAICDAMPKAKDMLKVAKELGYSETAFLHQYRDGWRIRYFAPELEVPFCGHATIAAGFVLGEQVGQGRYTLYLNDGSIEVSVKKMSVEPSANIEPSANLQPSDNSNSLFVSLNSPPTFSEPAPVEYTKKILNAFSMSNDDINPNFPIRFASAGAKHLIFVLKEHHKLKTMNYDFDRVKELMSQEQLITLNLLWPASPTTFYSRNPFPPGGVYEDPATGAAAAAFAGYLRDIAWQDGPSFEVLQGEDMGSPSRLLVKYQPEMGSSIAVSGEARYLIG